MAEDYIMQMRPFFGQEEKSAVCNYMDQDGFITEFKNTEYFAKLICEYTKSKFCVVVNNGTVALTLASIALGVKAGDEVIVPNYTMIATPNSVALFGAKPIFVDVEKSTLCIDFKLLKNYKPTRFYNIDEIKDDKMVKKNLNSWNEINLACIPMVILIILVSIRADIYKKQLASAKS